MKNEDLNAIVGRNLSRLRKTAGMTQAQLSERVGISAAFLSRVECGNKMVSVDVLNSLAEVLGVSCDALLREETTSTEIANICKLLSARPGNYIKQVELFIHILDSVTTG